MTTLWQDLRYASRILRQAPGFTAVVVFVLAIGIGANSAIFSLLDAVLLRPLPFRDPGQLVMVWEHPPGYARNRVSPLNFVDWSEQNHVFSSMAAVSGASPTLTSDSTSPERLQGQAVTMGFFNLLGVTPLAGRLFTSEDERSKQSVVILSERLWRNRFGGDLKLVGGTIQLDGQPVTVIGIVPADFQILFRSDLWMPFLPQRTPEQRRMHYLQVIGRLKPGLEIEQAQAGMDVVAANIARISPETNKDWTITIEPLRKAIVGSELRVTSVVLAGVVSFILLMACANVANLLLARGAGRTREIAVRAALGGSTSRIMQQLLTESGLLCGFGGVLGVALAWMILLASPSFLPPGTLPAGLPLGLDVRVITFAIMVTLATGLLFGLAPAWQAARISLTGALRSGGRTVAASAGRFRTVLAAGEIAMAVLLVAGAGLLLRTIGALNDVDPGYRAKNVLTMSISLPIKKYVGEESIRTFYLNAEREIASIPGVTSVAFATNLPVDGWDIGQGFEIVGDPPTDGSKRHAAHYQMVGVRYFETLGIALQQGRSFSGLDTASSTPICIVNEEFVRRYMKGRNPVGMQVKVDSMGMKGPVPVVREIVGVSRQVNVQGLGEREKTVEVYVPATQNAWYWSALAVRTKGDPISFVTPVKAAIAKLDKGLPAAKIRTMEEVASESVAQPRFRAGLVSTFALLALVLAAAGIFGVIGFSVAQRTREFGIRMALGARWSDVLMNVIAGGLKITVAGIAAGLLGAAALTRLLTTLLFGVKPLDPVAFLAAPAVLSLIAILACMAPAIRAARIAPSEALRQE